MSQRIVAYQAAFSGGMVDGVDVQMSPDGSMPLVAWLDNFDHTKVEGAIVKRDGWRFLWDGNATYDYLDSPHAPGIKTNVSYTLPVAPIERIQLNLGDFCDEWKTYVADDQNHVLGVASTRHSENDKSNSVLVVFARFYASPSQPFCEENGTMVIAYGKEKGQTVRSWQNSFINSYTGATAHPFPGWMARGILTDWTRFGGTIVYATELNKIYEPVDIEEYRTSIELPTATPNASENMYPVYVWQYVDNSFKRDKGNKKYWYLKKATGTTGGTLPLDDLTAMYDTDNKYSTFKTRYPSTWLTRNDVIGVREMTHPSQVAISLQNYEIEVCVGEIKSRTYSQDRTRWESKAGTDYYDEVYRTVEGYRTGYPLASAEIPTTATDYLNPDATFTESLEMLRDITVTIPESRSLFNQTLGGEYQQFVRRIVNANYAGREMRLDVLSAPMTGGGVAGLSYEMRAPNEDDSPEWDKKGHPVVGVRLPNYLANKNPRYWLKGEKIPLVVTAVVNGTEIKLLDYCYEVKTENYQPNPVLYCIARSRRWTSSFNDWANNDGGDKLQAIYSRVFYGVYDSTIESEGRYLFPTPILHTNAYKRSANINNYLIDGGETTPGTFIAHCWEPFNPTQEAPFVVDAGSRPVSDWYYIFGTDIAPITPDGFLQVNTESTMIGHRPYATEGTIVWVMLRFKDSFWETLYELGVSKFNIYIAKASQTESLLQSIGLFAPSKDVPPTYYGRPVTEEWREKPQDYGLLHTFVLDGEGKPFAGVLDTEKWKTSYRGEPTEHQGWAWNQTSIYPWPTDEDGTFLPIPIGGSVAPMTPDFWVWDYATDQPTLTLNSDGNYWQGRAAKCVEQIKGRVFIGGCIDEKGYEEPGIVRYSAVQRGVISLDVFNKSDFVQFGSSPVVCLKEFREQLWVFNRHDNYRLQMPSITDISSWEILEKIAGQGTFAPMTVVSMPYGVVWLNENGVWLSDGRMPENLAKNILPMYQWLATLRPDPLARSLALPAVPIENGYNPYMSLDYDPVRDELVITTPTATPLTNPTTSLTTNPVLTDHELRGELRLIFDMKTKSWRGESMSFPEFGEVVSRETVLFGP